MRLAFANFAGDKCSVYSEGNTVEDPMVHIVRNCTPGFNGEGISANPQCLITGGNSGAAAVSFAFLTGPRAIITLGIDGGCDHWFGEHPTRTSDQLGPVVKSSFTALAAGLKSHRVRAISCGALGNSWERMDIADALRI